MSSKSALSSKMERVIYVEGKDDAYFIDALLNEINADRTRVGVVHLEGDGALPKEIDLLTKSAAYVQRATSHLAFFLDADNDAAVKIDALSTELVKRNIPAVQHGTLLKYDNDMRSVGAFIFPDGTNRGELEDLLLRTVDNDERLTLVADTLRKVEDNFGELNKRSKRIARMYMSVLPVKPCGVGRGYCEEVFEKAHPAISAVRDFLAAFCTQP